VLKPFLTANWRYLAMLNFAVDPALLTPLVPAGTELDFYNGETFLSLVGFLFLDTRVMSVPVPLHRDFEEVNLRFYVRRRTNEGWRRGVAFVREIVPRQAIAVVARVFYGEPYSALPMRHEVVHRDGIVRASYEWRRGRTWESLVVEGIGDPQPTIAGSYEEFITEHYWGYTARGRQSSEYRVAHPRWQIWKAQNYDFRADVASLYGQVFVEFLTKADSAFIAEGSDVQVFRKLDDPALVAATAAKGV
jgi:uncharacterized protein